MTVSVYTTTENPTISIHADPSDPTDVRHMSVPGVNRTVVSVRIGNVSLFISDEHARYLAIGIADALSGTLSLARSVTSAPAQVTGYSNEVQVSEVS